MTILEKKIVAHRIGVFVGWLMPLAWSIVHFWLHPIMGVLAVLFHTPIWIWVLRFSRLYVPKLDYFVVCRGFSRQQKECLSKQCQNSVLRFKEVVFTEEFVVFTKLGAVLDYKIIKSIKWERYRAGRLSNSDFTYEMKFETETGQRYRCQVVNDDSFFKGPNSAFDQAMALYREKRMEVSNLII